MANSSKLGKLELAKFKVRKVRVMILMHTQQKHTDFTLCKSTVLQVLVSCTMLVLSTDTSSQSPRAYAWRLVLGDHS